jgi:hypothetical protein
MVTVCFAIVCVYLRVSISFLNHVINFHETWYELYVIGSHFKSTLNIFLRSVIKTWPAAAPVRAQFRSFGICGGHSDTGTGFLRVLRFPLPILIPPTAPHSSSTIRGRYNRPVVVNVPSGLSLTPPPKKRKK